MPLVLASVASAHTGFEVFWFIIIAILWSGYFVLDGFDFGIGIMLGVLARDDLDRRVLINTIGPVWDGNEVWLLVAGGATFAAFPNWYATLFSGFYLPLFLILAALIFRGVAFEFRSKRAFPGWRLVWDHAIFWGASCRRCCGGWPSPTSCGVSPSAQTSPTSGRSSISSIRTRSWAG